MISSSVTPAVSNPVVVTSLPAPQSTPCSTSGTASTTNQDSADVLSLSQPGALATGDGVYERTSLKIRSHSLVKTTDDGRTLAMSQTGLRFRYDFEAADGTKIRLRAEANLNYSQINDSDEGSQSMRLRAAVRISVLQGNVSSGVSPLLDSPDASAKDAISQAMDLFRQATDAVTSAFLGSDPLDGDSLISGLVDAFNGLSDSIGSIFSPPQATPAAVPVEDVGTEVPPLAAVPSSVLPMASDLLAPGPPDDNGQSHVRARSVMIRVRLQMVQSLKSLIGVFDSAEPSVAQQSSLSASTQVSARYHVNMIGKSVDAQV